MKETRIVVLNSLKYFCKDQKYNANLFLGTQQQIIDFYGKMGFELDQVERTKIDETHQIILNNRNSSSGFTAIPIRNRSDETIVVLSRNIPNDFDSSFEDDLFAKLINNYDSKKRIHDKYDFWVLFCAICCIILYGIPPYIILKKKRKSLVEENRIERDKLYNSLNEYRIELLDDESSETCNELKHSNNDSFNKLSDLKKMLDSGLISQDDYEQKKDEILNTI